MYLSLLNENINEIKNNYSRKPFFVFISLTNTCNANCMFCDVRKNKELICSVDIYKLIDELALMGTKYIHFTGGGEPFTDKNIVDYMKYATKQGLSIIFITNGFLLKNQVQNLKDVNIKAVFVSIDSSYPEVHNSLRRTQHLFENAIEGINLLKESKPDIKINLNHVVNKKNIDNFDKFIELKEKANFDYINPILIKDCDELTPSAEQIKIFNKNKPYYMNLLKKHNLQLLCKTLDIFDYDIKPNGERLQNEDMRCYFANYVAFIDCPSGKIYPCDCSVHCDREIYCLGSLHNNSFEEIWNGEKRNNLIKRLNLGKMSCKTKCDEANCIFNKTIFEKE